MFELIFTGVIHSKDIQGLYAQADREVVYQVKNEQFLLTMPETLKTAGKHLVLKNKKNILLRSEYE